MQQARRDGMHLGLDGRVPVVIGVTGHRDIPVSDFDSLKAATHRALQKIEEASPDSPHVLLSSLAEGGDRIAAHVGIERGWVLGAILPAPVELYSLDFQTAASREEFEHLLGQAAWVEALPAKAMTPSVYRAAGIRIAKHSLYLLAYWDGDSTIVEGGTADTVNLFLHGIPEKRLAGAADNSLLEARPVWQIVARRTRSPEKFTPSKIGKIVRHSPDPEGYGGEHELERWKAVLQNINRFNRDAREYLGNQKALIEQSRGWLDKVHDDEIPDVARAAARLYAVADAISMDTQKARDRQMKVLLTLAGIAIVCEQIYSGPIVNPWFLALAIAAGVCAGFFYNKGTRKHLENLYLDYRALAEVCRVQYFWKRAGLTACAADHFLRDQRDELEWIRRAVRTTELLPCVLKPSREDMGKVSETWLGGQQHYFIGAKDKTGGDNARKNQSLDEIWSRRAGTLFWLGIAATVVLTVVHFYLSSSFDELAGWMTLVYGLLFAGAGLVKVHQEVNAFSEHANRYRRMGIAMAVARRRLDAAFENGEMGEAENVLLGAGRDALDENGGWLILHRDRPVKVPLGN